MKSCHSFNSVPYRLGIDLRRRRREADTQVVAAVRVVASAGEAAEVAAASLAFYGHLTGVEFALPKADMVAVPGKGGAMENWVRAEKKNIERNALLVLGTTENGFPPNPTLQNDLVLPRQARDKPT
jgi:hypothetical protein